VSDPLARVRKARERRDGVLEQYGVLDAEFDAAVRDAHFGGAVKLTDLLDASGLDLAELHAMLSTTSPSAAKIVALPDA